MGSTWACSFAPPRAPNRPSDLGRSSSHSPTGVSAVDFDPGSLLINGESPSEAVRLLGPHIRHVRATDGVRDLAQGRGIETQLGRGAADFPDLAAMLEEQQYRGWFTIQRRHADDPVNEIAQSIQYLRSMWE